MVPRGLRTYSSRQVEIEVMADEPFSFLDGLHIAQQRVAEEYGRGLRFQKCNHIHKCAKAYIYLVEEGAGVHWHPKGG